MKFFGRTVSDTGCELLIKGGSRFPNKVQQGDLTSWLDGQIVSVRPLGYHTGQYIGYCRTLIKLPNVDYLRIGGRAEVNWKRKPDVKNPSLYDRLTHTLSIDNKYMWELPNDTVFDTKRKTRDWLLDFKWMVQQGLLTIGERESIYDFNQKSIITLPAILNLEDILKHEDDWERLSSDKLLKHASITSGTYSIGDTLDYDDITDFESAIGAQMDGNLTGEHADEETTISSSVQFDTDTNSYLLKLTANTGAEHDGSAYGNGARINCATICRIYLNADGSDTLDDIEISNLAIDVSGYANEGITSRLAGNNGGGVLINRVLIKGDSDTNYGIYISNLNGNVVVRNSICYGIGGSSGRGGFFVYSSQPGRIISFLNNTAISCYDGFRSEESSTSSTFTFTNNLAQDNTVDFADAGAGFGTTAKNISEDATSPDAAYRSKDLHTNSVFVNYANDNFKIDKNGDSTNLAIIDDGEDLSAIFTDDINHDAGRRS